MKIIEGAIKKCLKHAPYRPGGMHFGKGGANITAFREQSGARITISTAQASPERIVTVTGDQTQINKAVKLLSDKMHDDINSGLSSPTTNKVPVTIRLIVPASQCGSIIGKGGVKIKEIRDSTGCAIQVQSEMLPNSSERTVTLSGVPTAIFLCINTLIEVMTKFPAKTATVPYKPQGGNAQVVFHQGHTYVLKGQFAGPNPGMADSPQAPMQPTGHSFSNHNQQNRRDISCTFSEEDEIESMHSSVNPELKGRTNFPINLVNANTQEVTVGNDVIGCIIGVRGQRINEIRMISGAQIKIDQSDTNDAKSRNESQITRKILISGSLEEITLAQYLINLSVQLFENKEGHNTDDDAHDVNAFMYNPDLSMRSERTKSLLGRPPNHFPGFGGNMFNNPNKGPSLAYFGSALANARRTFMANKPHGSYKTNRNRGIHSHSSHNSSEDFSVDVDMIDDSSPNGRDKRKHKREKFQPY